MPTTIPSFWQLLLLNLSRCSLGHVVCHVSGGILTEIRGACTFLSLAAASDVVAQEIMSSLTNLNPDLHLMGLCKYLCCYFVFLCNLCITKLKKTTTNFFLAGPEWPASHLCRMGSIILHKVNNWTLAHLYLLRIHERVLKENILPDIFYIFPYINLRKWFAV